MQSLRVQLADRSYDIYVTSNDLAGTGPFARKRCSGKAALVVADEKVAGHAAAVEKSLAQAGFQVTSAPRPSGEAQKSIDVARELYDKLVDIPADRQTLVAAVGGGVIGDLAGFVA